MTTDAIAAVLSQSFDDIVLRHQLDYESEEFKEGIDTERLAFWAPKLLVPFVALDPRGGFINHEDMVEAFGKKLKMCSTRLLSKLGRDCLP